MLTSPSIGSEVPLTLEKSTSSRDTTFMENGSPVAAFATNPEAGLAISGWRADERLTWALGAFSLRAFTDDGDASQVLARLAGRLTWLPVLEGEGAGTRLLHVGLSGSYAYAGADGIRYRSRPESHLAPYVVDVRSSSARGDTRDLANILETRLYLGF